MTCEASRTNLGTASLADAAARRIAEKLPEALKATCAYLGISATADPASRVVRNVRLEACEASASDLRMAPLAHPTLLKIAISKEALEAPEAARADLGIPTTADPTTRIVHEVRFEARKAMHSDLSIPSLANMTLSAIAIQEEIPKTFEAASAYFGITTAAHGTSRVIDNVSFEAREATHSDLGIASIAIAATMAKPIKKASQAQRVYLLIAPLTTSTSATRAVHMTGEAKRPDLLKSSLADATTRRIQDAI